MENNSVARTAVEPIDISSSEESDIDDIVMETSPATFADSRLAFLTAFQSRGATMQEPYSATMQEPYSIGYGGFAQGLPSKGNSSIFNNHKLARIQMQPSSSVDDRLSNKNIFNRDDSNDYIGNKGSLPQYFQPSTSSASWSAMLSENVERKNQTHEAHADTFYPRVPKADNGMDYNKENLSEESDDEILMYEKVGSTIVPPAFRPVRTAHYDSSGYEEVRNPKVSPSSTFASTSQYTNKGNPVNHNDVAEEKVREQDERLIYRAALQDLNQPKKEASLPDGLLSVPLLRHQKIALAWFLEKETTSLNCLGGILADDQGLGKTISMIALIQMQRYLESKPKSEYQHKETMEALNLDDDDDFKPIPSLIKIEQSRVSRTTRPAAGTLVVCPASVLRQWARELKEKVTDEAALKVLIYHGGNRTKDPVELASYDVVLTTYAIVTNEVPKAVQGDEDEKKNGDKYGLHPDFSKKPKKESKKRKKGKMAIDDFVNEFACGALAKVAWLRVILDEAQIIKNHKTKAARACCGLRAKRRWCLSGTPLQNTIDELFSYFRFLRYEPFATYISFQTGIKHPISRNSSQGYLKLQAVLRAIMLRRTKGTLIDGEPILNLPPKTINLDKIEFSSYERDFYDKLESNSRSQFKKYADAGTVNQNYASILLMLLRLRQACGSPQLTKKSSSSRSSVSKASLQTAKKLPRDMLLSLLDRLETSLPICCLCGDPPEETVISSGCGHIFCRLCILEYLTGDDYTCPTPKCKQQLKTDFLFSRSTLRICLSNGNPADEPSMSFDDDESLVMDEAYLSSKIKAAIKILESECKPQGPSVHSLVKCEGNSSSPGNALSVLSDCDLNLSVHTTACSDSTAKGPVKAIVFSQWTRMLDLLEIQLEGTGLKYRRLDGTMNLTVRDEAVRDFNTNPEVTVMLMSLKAGNLGLNMVAATHVMLLDLWWNPTTEDQAVDRAHRIGQTRPVTVTRFTIKNTVEERILLLQEEKRKMVASAFGEDYNGGSATRLTVQDLKYLFKF